MPSTPFTLPVRRVPGRFAVPAGAVLVAVCAACPAVAPAQSVAMADTQRVDLWGTAVDARERAEKAVSERRADDATAQPRLLRGMSTRQSQWSGTASLPQPVALDGAARHAAVERSGPALQAADVSLRWGVATPRNAVDVGVGAGAYKARLDDGLLVRPGRTSLSNGTGPGAEVRRDAVVPTVSVGMRHSLSDAQRLSVYAGGSASVAPASVGEFYTTKVKVEWLPTRNSSIGFEHAAVNMRFGPNSNIALRVRHGGPMVYYRSTF